MAEVRLINAIPLEKEMRDTPGILDSKPQTSAKAPLNVAQIW